MDWRLEGFSIDPLRAGLEADLGQVSVPFSIFAVCGCGQRVGCVVNQCPWLQATLRFKTENETERGRARGVMMIGIQRTRKKNQQH